MLDPWQQFKAHATIFSYDKRMVQASKWTKKGGIDYYKLYFYVFYRKNTALIEFGVSFQKNKELFDVSEGGTGMLKNVERYVPYKHDHPTFREIKRREMLQMFNVHRPVFEQLYDQEKIDKWYANFKEDIEMYLVDVPQQ